MSGSGISWVRCKSAPCSRQITTPAPHHSVFTGRMPFLPPYQQCQSTEGKIFHRRTDQYWQTAGRRVVVASDSRPRVETASSDRRTAMTCRVHCCLVSWWPWSAPSTSPLPQLLRRSEITDTGSVECCPQSKILSFTVTSMFCLLLFRFQRFHAFTQININGGSFYINHLNRPILIFSQLLWY